MKRIKESGKRLWADVKQYGPALIIFAVYYGIVHLFRAAFCPMIQITGLPCAGCGLTRAFLFILRGEFERAVYIQPMAFAVIAFVAYCAFFRYLKGTKIVAFSPLFVILVSGMLVFYVVRMVLYFPDRVPYVYAQDNLLANYLPGYEEFITRVIAFLHKLRGN